MRKLKKLFLFLPVLLSISCAVKIKTIEDDFYGEKNTYYQTSYMDIDNISLRFTAYKNLQIIIVEALYTSSSAFTVSKNDNIVLRFNDNTFINLNYSGNTPSVYSYYYYNSYLQMSFPANNYTISANAKINNIGILTAIRIENSGGFKNLEVTPSFAKKFLKAYEDIKNKINE